MAEGAEGADRTLLACAGLVRSFPGVKAVDGVDLSLGEGEIHALLGENGAGKSTLVKMIYGVLQPDAGVMTFSGARFQPRSPAEARARGVGMVFQHFSLFEAMTATENVALGLAGAIADDRLADRIVTVSKAYGLDIDPGRRIGTLSAGERQRIEIARCLLQDPRLVIMDEPTSVLTPQEVGRLFETLRRLAGEGRGILYISHKLEEVRALCTRATILRGGRRVGACDPRAETARSLAEMMIGTSLQAPLRPKAGTGPVRLAVEGLSMPADGRFGVGLEGVTFEVRGGEVFGIAGVAGNGQGELMDALIGERTTRVAATITVDGVAVGALGPLARRQRGLAFLPEERLGHGAVPGLSLAENMALADTTRGFVDWEKLKASAGEVIARFGVRTTGADKAARGLSGGNLQKFLMGRELATAPRVFVASQPTWGVDAGAAQLIHREIAALAEAGAAVVLISQDLDELFALAHRIAVIAGGRLSPARPVADLTVEQIGLDMGAARHA